MEIFNYQVRHIQTNKMLILFEKAVNLIKVRVICEEYKTLPFLPLE